MAHLPMDVIGQRRAQLQEEIVELWQELKCKKIYVVVCPCEPPTCVHMPEGRFPRLKIGRCFYPGELDYLMAYRPFLQEYGFEVTWLCLSSVHRWEFSCGAPIDHGGIRPLNADW